MAQTKILSLTCKKISCSILGMTVIVGLFACDSLNIYDKYAKKHGLWVTMDHGLRSEVYYTHGNKNGVYKVYHQNGRLYTIGEYCENFLTGKAFLFDESGCLLQMEDSIKLNERKVLSEKNKTTTRRYASHVYYYNSSGGLIEDGLILYDESSDDESIRYGIWNYYDGELHIQRKVNYSNKYLLNFEGDEIK